MKGKNDETQEQVLQPQPENKENNAEQNHNEVENPVAEEDGKPFADALVEEEEQKAAVAPVAVEEEDAA